MRQYGYLHAIFLSFYSRKFYRDVVKNWGGEVVVYLLFLLLISWAAMMFVIQPIINQSQQKILNNITPQVPIITFKNGEATTTENRPYLIKDTENKELLAIIDTSGKYSTLEKTNAQFLLTKNQIMYKDSDNSLQVENIPKKLDIVIKPELIKEKVIKFTGYAWLALLPLFLIASLVYRLIQSLLYALLGKTYAAFSGISLSYGEILKLSIIAVTPAIVIATIFDLIDYQFHLQWFFYFVLTIFYIIFAIGSNKTTHK